MNKQNWAGNLEYSATRWHEPTKISELQTIITQAQKVRALGTRHCFNHIADTPYDLVSMVNFNQVVELDRDSQTVTVEGGMRYGELYQYLDREGFALHNLASLPHISVAGACTTATHGSGDGNGNLATAVSSLQLLTANGNLMTLTRDHPQFLGAVVGLGGLGIVTQITLDIQPTYNVRQNVYVNLPFAHLNDHFDEIMSSGYSVSLFTHWRQIDQIWVKQVVADGGSFEPDDAFWGAELASKHLHPIASLSAEPCTLQMGLSGAWHKRVPHFKLEFTPSNGEELQSEYFVPRSHVVAALNAITMLQPQLAPQLLVSEIRTVAADDLWMSPCYQQDCVAIHFTWRRNWTAVRQLLPLIEEKLRPFNGRPHWGKLFTMPTTELQAHYAKLPDFQRLLQNIDPNGKFRNLFLDRYIFGESE